MYINNKSISIYNLKLLERTILPSSFQVESFWGDSSLTPKINEDVKRKYKTLILKLEFKGNDVEIERNKSNLVKDISISDIRFKSLNNIYNGSIVSFDLNNKINGYEISTVIMQVIEQEEENSIFFSDNITLILNNTEITPCTLELTPTQNLIDVKITGLGEDIIIKNLTKDKKIVIDGEKGLVTENGLNKWKDYDSWSFPKLSPGENNISISKASVNTKLSYKARWI